MKFTTVLQRGCCAVGIITLTSLASVWGGQFEHSYAAFPKNDERPLLGGDGWEKTGAVEEFFRLDESSASLVYDIPKKGLASLSTVLPESGPHTTFTVRIRLRCQQIAPDAESTLVLTLEDGKRRFPVWFKPGHVGVREKNEDGISWHEVAGENDGWQTFVFEFGPAVEVLKVSSPTDPTLSAIGVRQSYTEARGIRFGSFNSRTAGQAEIRQVEWDIQE